MKAYKLFNSVICAILIFCGNGNLFAQTEVDVTSALTNPGFDEDLTFGIDGSWKVTIEEVSLSERSEAWIAADSTIYAHTKSSSSQSRPDGRKDEAVNGFIGRVNGWTIETNQEFPKCEWVYFGTVPYDLANQAIPIADDGTTYLDVPTRPEADAGEDNKAFVYMRAGWGGRAVYKQTVNLPVGQYRLEYWTINLNSNGTNGTNLTKVISGEETFADETSFINQEWTLHTIEFTSSGESDIQFGFESSGGSGSNPFLCIDGVKLYRIEEPFDPENPNEPDAPVTDYNLLENLVEVGAIELVQEVKVGHTEQTTASIDITELMQEVKNMLGGDTSSNTVLKALASEGVLTDSLTAAYGYWLDGNGFVCTPDAADRKLSIEVEGDETSPRFLLTVQPEAYAAGEAVTERLYFTNEEKYVSCSIMLNFVEQNYLLTFMVDGAPIQSDSVAYGTVIVAPEAPEKVGFTFAGWGDVPESMPANDVTLEAQYTINKYLITFVDAEGTLYAESLEYGDTIPGQTARPKEGYTFKGWDKTVAATVPADSVTYTAVYEINKYLVTFIDAEGTLQADSMLYGATITPPTARPKTGYTFKTWGDVAATVPADDVTYTAEYTINKYMVTFIDADGTLLADSMQYGATITAPNARPKTGYTFKTWGNVAATVPAEDVTYTAEYTINKYMVTFIDAEGTLQADSMQYGATITAPTARPKTGYTFKTWGNVAATVPAEDVTYTAEYTINKYMVTFIDAEGTLRADSMQYGATITVPNARPKTGYTFKTWGDVAATVPAEDVTYTAEYTINKYMVTFIDAEGTLLADSMQYGATITAPTARPKTGYTFKTWGNVAATVPADNVTYTAEYTINKYMVTFIDAEGTLRADSMQYGATITAPTARPKTGYTFKTWGDVATTVPAEDVTYTAEYIINKYLVTFIDAEGTLRADSMLYGATINVPTARPKTGYTFKTWGDVAATVPENNVTYTAVYEINKYLVTFIDAEGTLWSESLEYGSTIPQQTARPKTGYTFKSWDNPVAATVPADSVTYTAVYEINKYLVTFIDTEGTLRADSMNYGATITAPTARPKTGYTFKTWGNVAATVPAEDVTYTAEYTINQYVVTFISYNDTVQNTLDYGATITTPTAQTKPGYTFNGWDKAVATTVPAENVTYIAEYTINSYNIIYVVDDEPYQTVPLEYGQPIVPLAEPTKEGQTFSGWVGLEGFETMPDHDLSVTGSFSLDNFKTTFMNGDEVFATILSKFGEPVNLPPSNPEKTGYTFTGWGTVPTTMPAENITLYAEFAINKYLVTFVDAEGTLRADSMQYGATITAPTARPKTGYTFKTWGNVAATVPADNVTYTAEYTINKYLVTFIDADGTLRADSMQYGATIAAPTARPKEGYTFKTWGDVAATVPAEDVTYTAEYTINQYVVTFISYNDTVQTTLNYGAAITTPTAKPKTGYTFKSWDKTVAETVPAGNVTYTALYEINKYLVTFIDDKGTLWSESLEYGSAIPEQTARPKTGYTFKGWDSPVAATVPAVDVTYTAEYTINQYVVTFISYNDTVQNTLDYGATITAPTAKPKTGYTFKTWGDVATTVPAENVTYIAEYTINSYNIIYVVDDEHYQTVTLEYGQPIVPLAEPTKEGQTFSGWVGLEGFETMPDHDLSVTGSFSLDNFKTTFMNGDEVFATILSKFGEPVNLPLSNPEKTGYTFTGWGTVPSTMPAENITLYAEFVINKYLVTFIDAEGTLRADSMQYGATITAPTARPKTGYTFKTWGNVAATVPAEDVTYTAEYTPNSYKITFIAEGVTISEKTLNYGDEIVAPTAPAKDGYVFVGWSPELSTTVPDEDVIYVAQYEISSELAETYAEMKGEQTTFNNQKTEIDTRFEQCVNASNSVGQTQNSLTTSAQPYGNKFTAEIQALDDKLNNTIIALESYNQFQSKDFAATIDELYNNGTLLSKKDSLDAEMQEYSRELAGLSTTVDSLMAKLNDIKASQDTLLAAIADAPVYPNADGVANVLDPMGGLSAILQDKADIKKLIVEGTMESGDYAALATLPNLEELTLPLVNTGKDKLPLDSLRNLLVLTVTDPASVLQGNFAGANPNMMVYAAKGATVSPTTHVNVVVGEGSEAESASIILTDGYPVRIPTGFYAQRISYQRQFSKPTFLNQSAGWETIVLPFDVQSITVQDGRSIVPFGSDKTADAYFWLATVDNEGFKQAATLNANEPYIISMPNNEAYTYGNILGYVTFASEAIEVKPTLEAEPVEKNYIFTPVYEEDVEDITSIYVINDEVYQSYNAGSVFVRGLRKPRPFEGYITLSSPSGAKQRNVIPISSMSATGLDQIAADGNLPATIYTLDGKPVSTDAGNLPDGIYVIDNQKYFIRKNHRPTMVK